MITWEQVQAWLGDDATKSEMIELLTEIANGLYKPEQFKKDIIEYKLDNE